ncbi:MAG TPA: hypothetical protein VG795_07585 [Acidimicrobiia bacterium]|nr:hypothetical protein [Acidimicrobiia bacterium]
MNLGAPEILILLMMLALFVIPIWGIVDAATKPDAAWTAAGQSKVLWIVLQLVLGILGAIIYFVAIRPKLVAAAPPSGYPPSY